MNTTLNDTAITQEYEVSSARMEVDKFIVPTVTIFILLLLAFFLLFPLASILQLSFFKDGEVGFGNVHFANFINILPHRVP